MALSLGLGLTNDCDLRCPHCYRPGPPVHHLTLDEVRATLDALDVDGVNLGTGETCLNPQHEAILDLLAERKKRVSLVSNGLTVLGLDRARLARLAEVEISIDFPDRARMDAFRGEGAFDRAVAALERCAHEKVPTTVLAVMMRDNHRHLGALARLAGRLGAPLRVNTYQPVTSPEFLPRPDEFWLAVASLLGATTVLGCSEPVVAAAAAGLPLSGSPCGRGSIRVTPTGERRPCVYWPRDGRVPASEFRRLPEACRACPLVATCGGGCASRRALVGRFDEPDPFCPQLGPTPRRLTARVEEGVERLHVASVCTLLVRDGG